ncbi:11908_t:CDS:1, partial [Ambispora gerdemannii]
IEKKDVFSTSENNDSKKSNKAKEIELFENNSLAKNKRKQPTESEENPQQQVMAESINNENSSKKISRTNVDDTINYQIDWTLVSTSILATNTDLNTNEKNSNLSIATYSDQIKSNLESSTQIMNQQQQIDIEILNETTMDDLLILFENIFKYNENIEANMENLITIIFEKFQIPSDKIRFLQSLQNNILYRTILGFMYHYGVSVEKDYDQALQYYQQSADA